MKFSKIRIALIFLIINNAASMDNNERTAASLKNLCVQVLHNQIKAKSNVDEKFDFVSHITVPELSSLVALSILRSKPTQQLLANSTPFTDTVLPVEVLSAAASPDGKKIALGSNKVVKVWDIESASVTHSFDIDSNCYGRGICFSRSGEQIAAVGHRCLGPKIFDLPSNMCIKAFEHKFENCHCMNIGSVSFSHDDTMLTSVSYYFNAILWDINTNKEYYTTDKGMVCAAFCPVNKKWALGGGNGVYLYNDLEIIQNFPFRRSIYMGFSADGSKLFSYGNYDLKVWDIETQKELIDYSKEVNSCCFTPDSQKVAVGGSPYVSIWDLTTGQKVYEYNCGTAVDFVSFTPDSSQLRVILRNGPLRIFDRSFLAQLSYISAEVAIALDYCAELLAKQKSIEELPEIVHIYIEMLPDVVKNYIKSSLHSTRDSQS